VVAGSIVAGVFERRQIREEVTRELAAAGAARLTVEEKAKQAETATGRILEMEGRATRAFGGQLALTLEKVTVVDAGDLPGTKPRLSLELAKRAVDLEDSDRFLVVVDQLGLSADKEMIVEHFLGLARYWMMVQNYPRALARVERAIKLLPGNPKAYRELARTLSHWASESESFPPADRSKWLQRALNAVERARHLQGKDDSTVLFELAWTLDEMEQFNDAAEQFRKAREEERKEAAAEGREEVFYFTYNLACSLAKAKRFEEASEEVRFFLEKWPKEWELIVQDSDLEEFRMTSPWREEVEKWIEEARKDTNLGSSPA
jgi:tetratricopeptide (TPR) repeat protein